MEQQDLSYKAKQIRFGGRTCSVLCQDVNGPCPILALANVLLLRGQLQLPPDVGEVSEERLVQLVAGYLLDANSLEGKDVSEEHKLNLQHNLSDAIALLPKLTTGIDVNLRFHDIRGFEFTNEVAVFDLLDIGLVHGWLCDPQDEATCCAIGQKSYNELVMQLVTTLGDAATPKCVTPSGSFRAPPAAVGPAAPAAATPEQQQQAGGVAVAPQGAAGAPPGTRGAQPINADMLAAALQSSLRVDAPAAGPSSGAGEATPPQPVAASPLASGITGTTSLTHSESMRRMIDDMMSGLVKEAFTSQTQEPSSPLPSSQQQQQQQPSPRPTSRADSETADTASSAPPAAGAAPAAAGQSQAVAEQQQQAQQGQAQQEPATVAEPAGSGAAPDVEAEGQAAHELHAARSGPSSSAAASAGPDQAAESVALLIRWPAAEDGGEPGSIWGQAEVELRVVPVQPLLSPFQSVDSGTLAALEAAAGPLGEGSPRLAGGGSVPEAHAAAAHDLSAHQTHGGAVQAAPAAAAASSSSAAGAVAPAAPAPPDEGAVHDALLIQQFLEGASSQLTWHGLHALHDGLRPNELAVFFRNNHFNCVLKRETGLYILVTDQGYLHESDVVWEHLAAVDGDTQFVDSAFRPFLSHAAPAVLPSNVLQQPAAAAQQRQPGAAPAAEFEQTGAASAAGAGADASTGGASSQHHHPQEDADFALALALQQEEHDRLEREAQRAAALQAGQGPPAQRRQQQQHGARPAAGAQQPGAGSSAASQQKKKFKDKLSEECSIM